MDVRKWIECKVEQSLRRPSHHSRTDKRISDNLTPTITKLVAALRNLEKEAQALIAAHEVALRQDSGNTNIAVLELRICEARAALAEIEKE